MISLPRQADHLHRCSATSILPLPLLWSILHHPRGPECPKDVRSAGRVESLRVPLTILTISLLTPVFAWVSRKNPPRWLYRTKDDPPLFRKPGAPLETSQPVGKSLQEYIDLYLSKNTILGSHSEDFQRKLKEQMYGSVREIFAADNPFIKCREKLAEYVASFADWAVLCLKPDEKA